MARMQAPSIAACSRYTACCVRQTLPLIQIMYGIAKEHALDECTLDHLEGCMSSWLVRAADRHLWPAPRSGDGCERCCPLRLAP